MQALHPLHSPRRQRGISLFVVIVLVMLSMLLALWGSRTSLFNEMIVGTDADYQRAFEAAQALIQDAEFDIQGTRPDGSFCVPASPPGDACRPPGVATVWFPVESQEWLGLSATLGAATTTQYCLKGLCLKRAGNQDFWNDATTFTAMLPEGARYGQFTGAQTGVAGSKGSNPILKNTAAGQGGWYWIEVLPYTDDSTSQSVITNNRIDPVLPITPTASVVYRITAVARGLRANTQVVLQSTFVRQNFMN